MARGINLLLKQNQELAQNQILKKLSKTITTGVLLYCIGTAIIFFVYFLVARNNDQVKKEILQAETTVTSFKKDESLQTALKLRTKEIASLLSAPSSFYNNLVKIEKIIPTDTVIEMATISQDKIYFKGRVPVLEQLGSFLSSIESNKDDYTSLIVGPISKETGGGYVFSFEGTFLATK